MKKIISLMTVMVFAICVIVPVKGQSDVLIKAQGYWLNNNELNGLDAILTVEALGLDVEDSKNGFIINYDFKAPTDSYGNMIAYEDMDCGYLAKNIMVLAAMKIDPAKLIMADGTTRDLVAILKSKIDDNGNVFYGASNPETSTIYTMYALSIVEPDYELNKLGANLAKMQLDDGSWGYNGAWGGPDITGWAVGAMSLCNDTYQSSIEKAITYFTAIQQEDGAFVTDDSWSVANSNTQSCVIWGLLEYDQDLVKNGVFKNAYDVLMSFMLEDGSFAYKAGQDYSDNYATLQAALALGVYENGSLFTNIKAQYEDLFRKPDVDNNISQENIPSDVVTAAKTGDDSLVFTSMMIIISCGGMYLAIRKVFFD